MSIVDDLTGRRFGRLKVIERAANSRHGKARWRCKCDCGDEPTLIGSNLKGGREPSCGCARRDQASSRFTKHGGAGSPTYRSWLSMRRRCEDPSDASFPRYGGRGIRICERWQRFENFLADMGKRPIGKTLDRWPNGAGNYEPGNCRWATPKEQSQNSRTPRLITFDGVSKNVSDWARHFGIADATMHERLAKGWHP